jgi:hypothetical protein
VSKKHSANERINYVTLINESVHTSDDIDIGDIFAVNKNFIVVVRGFLFTHYYYIPLIKVEGWDGNVLWLKVTEEHIKSNYERNTYPDSSRYIVKDDFPYDKIPPDFPEPIHIPSKNKRKLAREEVTTSTTPASFTPLPPFYKCDLCDISLKSGSQLSNHLSTEHR